MGIKGSNKVTIAKGKPRPIRLSLGDKRSVRTQFGALPYRVKDGKVEVLLITTRGSGRWILPKGWPMDGETPAGAAAKEAFEEAGVEGKLSHEVLGFYSYTKSHEGERLPCVVAVFPLKVRKQHKTFPEHGQRRRKWVSQKKAAQLVWEPELRRIIRNFDPSTGKRGL
ncbi:NUDIX hydrolase [Aliiroseovarius zhejiangensis]|uniref:NUDIX hydrolase n=1 Tax=Aliiroseovarius zhejiangensis TaxID=1632025 RepID=A0ABQ3IX09_9RHOB|nr:NUDIX hydrolase [Aliiroseovarius zhejiangensis]